VVTAAAKRIQSSSSRSACCEGRWKLRQNNVQQSKATALEMELRQQA
jgi:hypothetical protein